MSSMTSKLLRAKAKRIYKAQAKEVPKSKRISFAQFFQQYKKLVLNRKQGDDSIVTSDVEEDYDFNDMVGMTDIGDDNLENDEVVNDV